MTSKRPFKFTTQEYATIFFMIGAFIILICFFASYNSYYGLFVIPLEMLLFFGVGIFFLLLGYVFPCYQISKWECNPYMDKLESGWTIWLRFTKSGQFAPQPVQTGPLGQQKGIVEGHKADIINRGDFPITLRNGNHAVIKYDLMSHNLNLNEGLGWKMIAKRYGIFGVNAFIRCIDENKTTIKRDEKEGDDDEKD